MRALSILAAALLACGCTPLPEIYQAPPEPLSPMHGATVQATLDCGGPYVAWSRITNRSMFPLRAEVSETMRCLHDGRIVGPYTYLVDSP